MRSRFLLYLLIPLLSGCSRFYSTRYRDIAYDHHEKLKLDVYKPKRKQQGKQDVLIFIHGGNWSNGDKGIYKFFGRGFARKNVVTVVIDYRLYPDTNYAGMAGDVARAIKWVKENISGYGGDPDKIYVSGHSAGAHLAALVTVDNSYFLAEGIENPVKGCILIDPFGLDMYTYLKKEEKYKYDVYRTIFTRDTSVWKAGSPITYLHKGMPEFLLFRGKKTYPNIIEETDRFAMALQPFQPGASVIIVPRKRHAGMIFSYANPRKKAYSEILSFMKKGN